MIQAYQVDSIINHLAAIFTYGLNNHFSYKAIEEHAVGSSLINNLENNEFDENLSIEKSAESAYSVRFQGSMDISFRGLFLAESYIKLFFRSQKSFEYLFLYWPLEDFANRYDLYHEMDFSNLWRDFELASSKQALLKKLSLSKGISYADITRLTGINPHSINKYGRDDAYLYSASIETLSLLASVFKVKLNLFLPHLLVSLDQTAYLSADFNRSYRNHLGLYYASYFDSRIKEGNYAYDEKENSFVSAIESRKIVTLALKKEAINIDTIDSLIPMSAYVVIFPCGYYGNGFDLDCLSSTKAEEILIIDKMEVLFVKTKRRKEITETIHRCLSLRANRACK